MAPVPSTKRVFPVFKNSGNNAFRMVAASSGDRLGNVGIIVSTQSSGALNVVANCSAKKVLPAPGIPTTTMTCGVDKLNDFIYDSIANICPAINGEVDASAQLLHWDSEPLCLATDFFFFFALDAVVEGFFDELRQREAVYFLFKHFDGDFGGGREALEGFLAEL